MNVRIRRVKKAEAEEDFRTMTWLKHRRISYIHMAAPVE